MRLLLDEHFSATIAQELRRKRIDAVAIQQERPDLQQQSDEAILRTAELEHRVVVTNNVRHFARLVEEFGLRGEGHHGVIFTSDVTFPRDRSAAGLIVEALTAYATDAPDDELLDSCIFLSRP